MNRAAAWLIYKPLRRNSGNRGNRGPEVLSLFLRSSVPAGPLFPLFLWSSAPTGPLCPLVLSTYWSSGPLYPPVLCFHCSFGPYCPLFPQSSVPSIPLFPLFLWSSILTSPLCSLFTDSLYPLTLPFCYIYQLIISYFRTRYMRDYPKFSRRRINSHVDHAKLWIGQNLGNSWESRNEITALSRFFVVFKPVSRSKW